MLGVQWHPEADPASAVIGAFVAASGQEPGGASGEEPGGASGEVSDGVPGGVSLGGADATAGNGRAAAPARTGSSDGSTARA